MTVPRTLSANIAVVLAGRADRLTVSAYAISVMRDVLAFDDAVCFVSASTL